MPIGGLDNFVSETQRRERRLERSLRAMRNDLLTTQVCRLTKSSAQSTSGTPNTYTAVSWDTDSLASGLWDIGQPTQVFPNRTGKWRVVAKVKGAAGTDSQGISVQVRLNDANNSPSEVYDANSSSGGYPRAEDVFVVINPGTDYFTAAVASPVASQVITVTHCILIAEWLGY